VVLLWCSHSNAPALLHSDVIKSVEYPINDDVMGSLGNAAAFAGDILSVSRSGEVNSNLPSLAASINKPSSVLEVRSALSHLAYNYYYYLRQEEGL